MESMQHYLSPSIETGVSKEALRLAAYEKAHDLFDEHAIKEKSFLLNEETGKGVYEETMIRGHIAEVARLDALFDLEKRSLHDNAPTSSKEEVKQYGDILEALIFDMIGRGGWFGENVRPVKTAKFDDYKNGVDILVDLEHARKPLALAVDVTFGFQGMQKKVSRIVEDIDHDRLSFVRYYRSEDGSYEGKVNNIAKVIVGVEMDTVQKMAQYWINNDDESLRTHYAQTLILSEIVIQLREYARYARKKGNEKIAVVYESELEKVQRMLDEKPDEHMDNYDRVYDCITRVVSGIHKEKAPLEK